MIEKSLDIGIIGRGARRKRNDSKYKRDCKKKHQPNKTIKNVSHTNT